MIKSVRKMTPGTQILVLCSLFSLPVFVALYFATSNIDKTVDFARWEQYGNQYQRPLEQLLDYLPQHQALAKRDWAASNEMRAEVSLLQARINSAFDDLKRVDEKVGKALQFTDEGLAKRKREHFRYSVLRDEWQ